MKRIIFLTLLLIGVQYMSCKGKNDSFTEQKHPSVQNDEPVSCECVDTLIITSQNQSKIFSKTSKVELVQFELPDNELSTNPVYKNLIKGGKFNRKKIIKRKYLDNTKIFELEKILYNKKKVCTKGNVYTSNDCLYQPHHAIVFYNNQNNAFSFLEICFICDNAMYHDDDNFGPMCSKVYDNLRILFETEGFSLY